MHICTKKNCSTRIAFTSSDKESVTHACMKCGKLIPFPTSSSKKMQFNTKLLIGISIVLSLLILLFILLIILNTTDSSNKEIPSSDQYAQDKGIRIGKINKKLYFLDEEAFSKHAKAEKLQSNSLDHFRQHLVSYLNNESKLIQDIYKGDSSLLWKMITQYNPKEIEKLQLNITENKEVDLSKLANRYILQVYNADDLLNPQALVIDPPKDTPKPQTKKFMLGQDTPSTYTGKIKGKTYRLELKNIQESQGQLSFQYSILGNFKHSKKKGTIDLATGKGELESFGNAYFECTELGCKITLKKINIVFTSN